MAFSKASVKYRPLRVGLVVRDGHVEDLVRAAGINSLLWGGIYNPILPLKPDDDSFADHLLNLFSVDILYPVTETPVILAFIDKHPFLRDPGHYAEKIFYKDWRSKKQVSGILDIKNVIDLLWTNEFKFKPSEYKSNFTLVSWDDTDPLANVFSVQFGFFPPQSDFKWDYKNIFLKGLRSNEVKIASDEKLSLSHDRTYGPMDVTCIELSNYATGGRFMHNGLYIGDSDNFYDLIFFWNLRASGISLVFLAKDHLVRNLPFVQSFLNFLSGLPDRHPNIPDWLSIYCNFQDEELRKTLSTHFSSKKSLGWHHIDEQSWDGIGIRPCYQVFKWQSVTAHVETAYDRYVVNIRLPEKSFLVDEDSSDRQQFAVIIDSYGDFGYPGHTLKIPAIRELNEFYSREISFNPFSLRVGTEGISKIITANDDSVDLYPLSKQVLIEKLFELSGIKSQTSQPGLIAKKIIEQIGGLEDARVLKIKGVRKILQESSPTFSITRGQAVHTIHKNDFTKHKKLYIEKRESPELSSDLVFDYLLKKDFFRAGLELTCVHCHLDNWLSLKDIDDIWSCEFCGGQNKTSAHLRNRGDWRFRKSGLFAKDNHQEGAIPVLLSLLALKRILDHSNFTYSTSLKLSGREIADCEIDLCIIQYEKGDNIEFGIGECKSDGGCIEQDDCDKLLKVARKLSQFSRNTEIYIIFAKTADSFSSDELQRFSKLNEDFKVILLTNRELEPYHMYWLEEGEIEEGVPEKYANSFSDLARNSYAIYLKNTANQ